MSDQSEIHKNTNMNSDHSIKHLKKQTTEIQTHPHKEKGISLINSALIESNGLDKSKKYFSKCI